MSNTEERVIIDITNSDDETEEVKSCAITKRLRLDSDGKTDVKQCTNIKKPRLELDSKSDDEQCTFLARPRPEPDDETEMTDDQSSCRFSAQSSNGIEHNHVKKVQLGGKAFYPECKYFSKSEFKRSFKRTVKKEIRTALNDTSCMMFVPVESYLEVVRELKFADVKTILDVTPGMALDPNNKDAFDRALRCLDGHVAILPEQEYLVSEDTLDCAHVDSSLYTMGLSAVLEDRLAWRCYGHMPSEFHAQPGAIRLFYPLVYLAVVHLYITEKYLNIARGYELQNNTADETRAKFARLEKEFGGYSAAVLNPNTSNDVVNMCRVRYHMDKTRANYAMYDPNVLDIISAFAGATKEDLLTANPPTLAEMEITTSKWSYPTVLAVRDVNRSTTDDMKFDYNKFKTNNQ